MNAAVWLAVTALLAFATSCGRSAPGGGGRGGGSEAVRIAAASDLRYALDELRTRLEEARPELDLEVSYGSSGTFFAQLVNGAPFDLFMSADIEYPRQLAERQLTVDGSEFTYGRGRLVLWVPASSPLDVAGTGMAVLAEERVARVAIANPEHAPYGRAAEAALRGAALYDRVKSKIVFGENVSQALQFVASGGADVGIVALSLATAPPVKGSGRFWMVPADLHPPLEHGGVIMRATANQRAAQAVRSFLVSEAGRTILKRYGFEPPEG